MKNKICFLSDGQIETGIKIITTLEKLGGVNTRGLLGKDLESYYYIGSDGVMNAHFLQPSQYSLEDIKTYNMKHKFKVGDKVNIPTTKSAPGYGSIWGSIVIQRSLKKAQPFLYITKINGEIISCNTTNDKPYDSGDYFLECDLTLYNQNETNMKTVKKSDLQKIHNVACPTWKKTIEGYAQRNVFGDTIELSQYEIDSMFKASDSSQHDVLEDVFGKQIKEINLISESLNHIVDGIKVFGVGSDREEESLIGLPRVELAKNTFYLNPNYNWKLEGTNLIVTR